MINDPLLPNSNTSHKETPVKTSGKSPRLTQSKRRPPARSAKILTVGLSTTAMLGMTTGYAFADLAQKNSNSDLVDPSIIATTPIANPEGLVTVQGTPTPAPRATPTPVATTPSAQSNQIATPIPQPAPTPAPQQVATPDVAPPPSATQEVVIDVPVATPGNGNSSWKNQRSGGSN